MSLLLTTLLLQLALAVGSPAQAGTPAPQRRYVGFYATELVETWAKHGSRDAGLQNFSGWMNLVSSVNASFLVRAKASRHSLRFSCHSSHFPMIICEIDDEMMEMDRRLARSLTA